MVKHLGLSVQAFIACLGRVNPVNTFKVQLTIPDRDILSFDSFRQPLEEGLYLPNMDLRKTRDILLGTDRFDHLAGGTATAIAPAEWHKQLGVGILLAIMVPGRLHILGIGQPVVGIVILERFPRSRKERDQHLRSIHASPVEGIMRETVELAPMD